MKKLATLLVLLCSFGTQAQSVFQRPTFGIIDLNNLSQKVSEIDSSAEAEVLYESKNIRFTRDPAFGYMMVEDVYKRIKIYKTSGLNYGTGIVRYFNANVNAREMIIDIKGNTFNYDETGGLSKNELTKENIFDEDVEDDIKQFKINMPNVKEGSIIEYQYTRNTPMNVRSTPSTWYFQGEIPKRWSEISTIIPENFQYFVYTTGFLNFEINSQIVTDMYLGVGDRVKAVSYFYAVKDAPIFKDEPFISTEDDYLSSLNFDLALIKLPNQPVQKFNDTWRELDYTLQGSGNWGRKLKATKDIKAIAETYASVQDPKEKASKIYDYVRTNFKWDGYTGVFAKDNAKGLLESKTGSASEINLFLCNLLQAAELPAYPVILSTRSHGQIVEEYPLLDRFNYNIVVIEIGDERIFLDATERNMSMGSLPARSAVKRGRMYKDFLGEFIDINVDRKSGTLAALKVEIEPESSTFRGTMEYRGIGIMAQNLRSKYTNMTQEEYIEELKKNNSEWAIDEIVFENFEDIDNSPSIRSSFVAESETIMPDIIYLNAVLFEPQKENPLKRKFRDFPVDFGYEVFDTYTAEITIPEGYEVESLPAAAAVGIPNKGGRFMFSVSQIGDKINVMSRLNLSQDAYPVDMYPYLRELFAKVVEKHAEQIVFKKKI